MAYTTPSTQVTGYVVTASDWNELINNWLASSLEAFTTDGDMWVATGANAGERVAVMTAANLLTHEVGGIEADISAVTTGDTLVGQSSGVIGLETAMSQAQAQAGSDTQVRGVSALRIKEAIDQLAGRGIAHAWCVWTAAGALVAGDLNVASITDGGNGIVTPVWDTDFADALYALSTSGGRAEGNRDTEPQWSGEAVGSVIIEMRIYDGSGGRDEEGAVVGFGDSA